MITTMIRLGAVATIAAALLASPAFAAGGGGGGGGGGGTDPYAGAYSDQKSQPAPAYPRRPGTRSTQKGKKPSNQSNISDPAFAAGYRAAYDTIYQRNDYADAIVQFNLGALQRRSGYGRADHHWRNRRNSRRRGCTLDKRALR